MAESAGGVDSLTTAETASAGHASPYSAARGSLILSTVVRQVTSSTGMYVGSTSVSLPVGIIATIVTVQYLSPAQFGQYGLLMVLASFLTVLYNLGLLHGTFLWVYGSSGDGGEDLEMFDGPAGRASITSQSAAMGAGVILTVFVVTCGTVVFFVFAKPLAAFLLGNSRHSNLIGLAALSGGAGSLFRLTCNTFRFERRYVTYALLTIARPISVLAASTVLIVSGYGLWGAVMGTAAPTLACAVAGMLASRRSYRFRLARRDVHQIMVRGSTVAIPVVALFALHNGDIYLLSNWVHGPQLGVYRLASRLGSPPSYFASAFVMTWGPLERSPLVSAAFDVTGQSKLRSSVFTYYMLVGFTIVVIFALFSGAFVLVAPRSYANAAKVVPLIALAFVIYGAYLMLLRVARPENMLRWYAATAVLSAVAFIGSGCLLIPALGVYGAPLAIVAGMSLGCAVVVVLNYRKEEPTTIEWGRIFAGAAVAVGVSALALVGGHDGRSVAVATTLAALLIYLPSLVVMRALSVDEVRSAWTLLTRRDRAHRIHVPPEELPSAERDALARFQAGTLEGSPNPMDYARLTRAIRRVGAIGVPSSADSRIGLYLASREPEATRDIQVSALIEQGSDAFELHCLDRLAKSLRRGRVSIEATPTRTSRAIRVRASDLAAHERLQLAQVLTQAHRVPPTRRPAGAGILTVRALRALRHSFGIGSDSAGDLTLAHALWYGDERDLKPSGRHELRALRRALKHFSRDSDYRLDDGFSTARPPSGSRRTTVSIRVASTLGARSIPNPRGSDCADQGFPSTTSPVLDDERGSRSIA
jgi:O-antigen/teichoic acid export membrane protein